MTVERFLHSVRQLALTGRRDVDVPSIRRALAGELVYALRLDQAHVITVEDGRPADGTAVAADGHGGDYALPAGDGRDALSWVAARGRALAIPDASVPGVLPSRLTHEHGLASAAVLPLHSGRTVRGLAVLGSRTPRDWHADELEAAGALVAVAGVGLALQDARRAAALDPLTGCLNHGAMHQRLAEEIARARRHATPLSIALLDLDDFKYVNDTYGHLTGDELLRQVADALRSEYRRFDQIARYGGDEFVIILPNVSGVRADIAAARALRVLRQIGIQRENGELDEVTVSCGVADWREPEGPEELLERADRALRASKAEGKNGLVRAAHPVH